MTAGNGITYSVSPAAGFARLFNDMTQAVIPAGRQAIHTIYALFFSPSASFL